MGFCWKISDFGGSDRYENVGSLNRYRFLPDSTSVDQDVIADERADVSEIYMGDRRFGTDVPVCVSEVSCTMVHDGRTFNLGMQGDDLVIQAQGSSHSVRVEEFENGDFGIDLSKRRVEITGLRVDALVSLGNGNIGLIGVRLADLVPSPEGMIAPHVSYQIRDMNGDLVQATTQLLAAESAYAYNPEEYQAIKAIKLSDGNSFIGFMHRKSGHTLKGIIVNPQMQIVVSPFRIGTAQPAEGGVLQEVAPVSASFPPKEFGCAALRGEEEGFAVSWLDIEYGTDVVRVFARSFANNAVPKAAPIQVKTFTDANFATGENFPSITAVIANPSGSVDLQWANAGRYLPAGTASLLPSGELRYPQSDDPLQIPTYFSYAYFNGAPTSVIAE